jgi:hypothetical protein
MSKGLLAQWRRGVIGRGFTGALLLAVPVATAAVIGFSGGFGSVTGGLSELTTGPDAGFATAPPADGLAAAVVSVAGDPGGAPTGGGVDDDGGDPGDGPGGGTNTPGGGGGGGDETVPNVAPDVPRLPGGAGDGADDTINDTVDGVVGGVNDTVGGALGGN